MKTIKELLGLSEAKKKKMKGEDPCWDNYEMVGTKKKNGREVPNCVPKNEEVEIYEAKVGDTVSFHHELKAAPGTKMKKSGTVEKVQGDDVLVKVKDKYGVKRHQVKMGDLVKEATLPPHLVKLIKDKQLDKVPMKHVTPRPEKQSHTIKDATPKGYGPTKEEVESTDENFGADFLAMARQKNPNARLVTPEQKKKEAEELAKKRADLKPAHAAPTSNPRPLGGHDPKSNRSYSEEIEQVDELNKDTVYSYNKKSTADTEKLHKKLGEFIRRNKPAEANKTAHKLNKRMAGQERADARLNTEEAKVQTSAQVTKHFEMGQSTPSGVPKWVAEPLKKKKKKVEEAGDPELMGGAVSKPTASGNNPKLADKFMKAFRKMKSPANISCKTVGMISTCEEEEKDLDQLFTEAMKKDSEETSTKKVIKRGEQLSGKQEPVKINPEIQRNQIGR